MLITLLTFICNDVFADLRPKLLLEVTKNHRPITYQNANLYLFTVIENRNGVVCSVYSPSECLVTDKVPSPKVMNIEHTWPQSEGANGIAKSDLHHLFATSSATNSTRSSLPFCNVTVIKWTGDQSRRGYSKFNEHCFEPPDRHKGNVARALFYFSIRYQFPIDSNQEYFLRQWHLEDPVDQDELERNNKIFLLQNNSNPFITSPEIAAQISDF